MGSKYAWAWPTTNNAGLWRTEMIRNTWRVKVQVTERSGVDYTNSTSVSSKPWTTVSNFVHGSLRCTALHSQC